MKMILAIVQPPKLDALRAALDDVAVTRMTACDAQGYARQRGRTEMYRGNEYQVSLLRKTLLEILVNDDFLERSVETIQGVGRSGPEGAIGDGKLFVLPAERVIRIRDGLEGPEAV